MDYYFLSQTSLFMGCKAEDIPHMLSAMKHKVRKYNKGQFIYTNGEIVREVCVVLSGSVQIENVDLFGKRSILGISEAGDIFAESYACISNQPMLVDVVARENTEILRIDVPTLFSKAGTNDYAAKLIENLLRISSQKNLKLSMRILHSAPKTIRARLYSYFSEQISIQESNNIVIPLDRQQLADYLGVDRTALSKELGKMRDEGLITFHKNEFHILAANEKS